MGEAVPPPETSVLPDGLLFRCELVVYFCKGGQVKDVRLRGPLRGSRNEALKDCVELRQATVDGGPDPTLEKVRQKRKELEAIVWNEKDIRVDELRDAEGPVEVPASWSIGISDGSEVVAETAPVAALAGDGSGPILVNIEERVAKLREDRALDESAAAKLASVFRSRAALGCDLLKDFEEIDQHLAASNKPSALVSMKLGELRDGRPIGPCRYTGGGKDADKAMKRAQRLAMMTPQALPQVEEKEPLFKPVGPRWRKPGPLCKLPQDTGDWLVHERQESGGKYRPWMFFNSDTGRYFQEKDSGEGYIGIGVPHNPQEHALTIRAGSASLPSKTGKKLDMAVLLPELHKTGAILKQPLEFLDRPASLLVLCDGLRDTAAATEFCVKKFHSLLLPRLSARATGWEDFELVDILQESTEALDSLLKDAPARFAGCNIAVALLVGTRLIVGSLGSTRCLLCTQSTQEKQVRGPAGAQPTPQWNTKLLTGGTMHTAGNKAERLRIASAGNRLIDEGAAAQLHPRSAPQALLDACSDDQERELLRISRATNPFAALGLTAADMDDGSSVVRRIFRKRSLVVHPDKVGGAIKERAASAFAKLEAAVTAVEAMMQADASAAALLAQLFSVFDSSWPEADPAAAVLLLGVQDGSSAKSVADAVRKRFHGPLSHLQDICPKEVKQALKILESAEAAIVRGAPALWIPPAEHVAIPVTRTLGCYDLKSPAPLLTTQLATQVIQLEPGSCCALALLTDGMRTVTDDDVSAHIQQHRGRPRAASLQLAIRASKVQAASHGEAVGAVCAFIDVSGSSDAADAGPPAPKRAKTSTGASVERVRVSHVLLRWAGLKGADMEERKGFPAPTRSQVQAEQELLALLDQLLAGEPKTRASRFKSAVLKHSECPSALNVPYADVGWIERGMYEAVLESAAFDLAVGDVSDITITQRGAHLLYRLA